MTTGQGEPSTNGKAQATQDKTTKSGSMSTAADILSRPRLPPKKKLSTSTSKKKQGKKNTISTAKVTEVARVDEEAGEPMDNDELLDQLLTQTTNELSLSSSEPTTPLGKQHEHQPVAANGNTHPSRSSTISQKLHNLGEDIKEVAHAVSSSISPSSPGKLAIPKRKPHRHKLKIANRQAAQLQAQLDAQLESSLNPVVDHRKLEAEALLRICSLLNLQIFEIIPDGHCLFSAIADQMNLICPAGTGEKYTYQKCRQLTAEYMRAHPDEFIHYLPGQDDGLEGGLMSEKEYESHCDRIRDSACWGGEPEILALSKALKYPIHVVQAFHPTVKVSDEFLPLRGNMALTISYHRKSYGLGEHYNSLLTYTY
ncbi:hypothetical protein VP01_625g8 [Puccinia sorghi]|uniref:OTU domain-containing protein n=1 Tax=Puccinia sorghi TaxID=27349 RepID=A0A0L6UGI2_9BASI|nr:hypothetical protein VP01_625g8 [Puccinia sorghi]